MKPWIEIASSKTQRGAKFSLSQRDKEYAILVERKVLMLSRLHHSEDMLAPLGCAYAKTLERPRVLIGGLGMGYTLRATLDQLPPKAEVVVAELMPAVLEWNQTHIAHLAGRPLDDKRARVELGDIAILIQKSTAAFDAVLLDVDNSPSAFTLPENGWLYRDDGLQVIKRALRPGGTLAVWSTDEDPAFEKRLTKNGFVAETKKVRGRDAKGSPTHLIFIGTLPPPDDVKKRRKWQP